MLEKLFNFTIFPGFLFTVTLGLVASWIDRKVTARVQWRVGPPWYQPFADIVKLSIKEITIPSTASKFMFVAAPFIGLSAAVLASTFLWLSNMQFGSGSFTGDLIVVVYLLTVPAIALILGALATGNPLASLGASREMKLILAYELPFVLAIIVPFIKSSGLLKLGDLISYQYINGPFIASPSGFLAALVMMFCIQAKLGLVPFDAGEAETEIQGGTYIEYSGMLLALFKLTKALLLVILPLLMITVFWGGFSVWKYAVILVVITLIRNTNPRVRIDQAISFFWRKMTLIAIIAVLLAVLGI